MTTGLLQFLLFGIGAGLLSTAVVVIVELRKTAQQETDWIRREDGAMSKVKDDANELARWVP